MPEERLLRDCTVTFGRTSGPGGQHRNKVETAVAIEHRETGLNSFAGERRRQFENRRVAIRRLRILLAREVRNPVDPRRFKPSPLWESRRQGKKLSINPKHADYPSLLAEALDVIVASRFDVAGAAGVLGITMSQLARLIRHDGKAFSRVNECREERGLPRLR